MTRLPLFFSALLLGFAISCAEDDDDDSDSTNNTTQTSNSSGNTSGNTSSAEETGEQTCDSSHLCVNGACHCTTPGKEDAPCDDEMACDAQCEVCM